MHKMAGAGQRERRLHGFAVANFADQNHVRRGAHRAAQRAGEGLRVETDLALVDDRFLVGVQELDRILDGQDVIRRGLIAVIDHRRERRRLAGAGGAHHQDQPALQHHQLLEHLGHAEVLELGHFRRDVAQHHRRVAALIEHVDAESGPGPARRSRNRSPAPR
jgi:hypothetical protein